MSDAGAPAAGRRGVPVTSSAPPLRWWGWGDHDGEIPAPLVDELRGRLGVGGAVVDRPVALEDVELPPSTLSTGAADALAALSDTDIHTDRRSRVAHAAGKSYSDLIVMRRGRPRAVPDAVVRPADEAEIAALLRVCEENDIAVVPFGGGTSVVGGVTPLRGDHHAVISLDLGRLDALTAADHSSGTATLQAGMRGPAAELALNAAGFTLGHFPQSFEYATIGGFAATRSAGQASCGYGRFDEMVSGLHCVTPRGTIAITAHPPNAAGPDLRQLVLGSEGTLGVISEVTVNVRRRPHTQWYEGWAIADVDSGFALLRRLAQDDALPDVARLSDPEETRLTLLMAGGRAGLLRRYLALRGQDRPCLLILGWDGQPDHVTQRRAAAVRRLRDHGSVRLGRPVGDAWRAHRFASPYLRDPLLDRGVLVETLETATTWQRLHNLRGALIATLERELTVGGHPPLVGVHVSHAYHEGASLYVTVMARCDGDGADQWARAKAAACDVLVAHEATVTHHHAVGTDHLPWVAAELGDTGVSALRALKAHLDPAGIMNPGKLLPPG